MVDTVILLNYREEASRISNNISKELEILRWDIIKLLNDYCLLKKLESVDVINIEEYLSKEQINVINKLIDMIGFDCSITW